MASLQAYRSHGIQYYRIVESFRNNGKPSIRVLAHLGRVDDILQRHQQQQKEVPKRSSPALPSAVADGAAGCRQRGRDGRAREWRACRCCGRIRRCGSTECRENGRPGEKPSIPYIPIWPLHLLPCHYLAEELRCRPRKLALAWPLGQVRAGPLADAPRPFSSCSPAAPRRKMRAAFAMEVLFVRTSHR